jgi:hypothetical protein
VLAVTTLLEGVLPAPAAEKPVEPLAGNARLEQAIRVSSPGISVRELLGRISGATGVALTAEAGAGESKLILYGPPRPLRDVLGDIAELFGHRWVRRQVGAEIRYLLSVDPVVRRQANAQAEAPVAGFLRGLDAQVRALRETPAQLARRPAEEPVRKYLSDPQGRLATELLATLTSRQRRFLIERGYYRLPFSMLPPQPRAVLQRRFEEQQRESREPILSFRAAVVRRTQPPDVSFTTRRWYSAPRRPTGWLQLRMFPTGTAFAFVQGPEPLPRLRGNPYGSGPVDTAAPSGLPEAFPPGRDWSERLERLAAAAQVPVVSDYYRVLCRPSDRMEPPGEADSASRCDRFARENGSLWWSRGRTVFFRKCDWSLRERHEIPDSWLDITIARLRAHGETPTLGDLLRVGQLAFPQQMAVGSLGVQRTEVADTFETEQERLAGLPELLALLRGRYMPRSREEVRLVRRGEVSREQYEAIERRVTLTFAEMTPDQRALLLPFLLAQREDLDGFDLERFSVTVWVEEPQDVKYPAPGVPTCRFVPLQINWRMGRSRGQFDRLTLPLTVPDDRRAETRVEPGVG